MKNKKTTERIVRDNANKETKTTVKTTQGQGQRQNIRRGRFRRMNENIARFYKCMWEEHGQP